MRDPQEAALELWNEGTKKIMEQSFEEAIALFTRSIEILPTAEAYTFRGWAYSFLDRIDEAIAECHKAIETDPTFGNPYNDIGCYLMQRGELDLAIPWLEKAKKASRYEPRHFPYLNMGRIRIAKGELDKARAEFEAALEHNPNDRMALQFLSALRHGIN
ncbi:MAG: tetratricopeptide repeat protein [Acidobacteriota bacterium]